MGEREEGKKWGKKHLHQITKGPKKKTHVKSARRRKR